MDTKLKNNKKFILTWAARLLAILISLVGAGMVFWSVNYFTDIERAFQTRELTRSFRYASDRDNIGNQVMDVYRNYISESYIKSGEFLNYEMINVRIEEIKESKREELQRINENYDQWLANEKNSENTAEYLRLVQERDELIKSLEKNQGDAIAKVKEVLIAERVKEFEDTRESLAKNLDILYSVYIDGVLTVGPDASSYSSLKGVGNYTTSMTVLNEKKEEKQRTIQVYVAYKPEILAQLQKDFDEKRVSGITGLAYLLGGCFLCLIGLIVLLYLAGPSNFLDRIYLDIAGLTVLGVYAVYVALITPYGTEILSDTHAYALPFGVSFALLYLLTPWLLVSARKRIREKRFFRSTFLVACLLFVIHLVRRFFGWCHRSILHLTNPDEISKAVLRHFGVYLGLCVAAGLFSISIMSVIGFPGIFVFFLLIIILSVYYSKLVLARIRGIEIIAKGTAAIKAGDLKSSLPSTGSVILDRIASDLNNIADGLHAALENEIRAEHMKVELITNVSHDLKTPLTSIMNYTDLLSKENLTPEKANEYVAVLKNKSERLKHLVDDLFEMSKASSGTGRLHMESLCLNDLLLQAVGEYEEKFAEKSLDLRISPKLIGNNDKLFILADSARMWRVLSNLFDNILKYTMESTRVYLDWGRDDHSAWFSLKNISSYEMNFPAEEIIERFKRGDDSRSTEGSGLGLAIVDSFMVLQGGKTDITIDGDLFKVQVRIPMAP